MRRTMHKWFWAWDFDKEERWLAEMSERGMKLVEVSFCRYVFEDSAPGAYQVRLELLDDMPCKSKSQRYIRFLEETGAQYLGSVVRWAYFRKKTEDGPFDLFSDIDSRIRHLDRILLLIGIVGGANLLVGINNLARISGPWTLHVMAALPVLLGTLAGWGCLRIYRQRSRLKRERALHE